MPRAKKTDLIDQALPGLDGIEHDPAPAATRTRARRAPAKPAGNRGRIPARAATGRVMSKAQMIAKVREEVGMYCELIAGGWEIRDPICSQVVTQDRIDTVADRLTRMIARSDTLLSTAANSGIVGDIVALISALWPIAREVWRAHGPSGLGHASVEEVERGYAEHYPAPAVAR